MKEPSVLVLSGTPLSGKSWLASGLKRCHPGLVHIDVDEIRQELYPNPERILLPASEERFVMVVSYTTLVARALTKMKEGCAVLLTGTFSRPQFKAPLELLSEVLAEKKTPLHIFLLTASDAEIERRIEQRKKEGGPSNIDSIDKYRWAKSFFQPIDFAPMVTLNTERSVEELSQEVLGYLNS